MNICLCHTAPNVHETCECPLYQDAVKESPMRGGPDMKFFSLRGGRAFYCVSQLEAYFEKRRTNLYNYSFNTYSNISGTGVGPQRLQLKVFRRTLSVTIDGQNKRNSLKLAHKLYFCLWLTWMHTRKISTEPHLLELALNRISLSRAHWAPDSWVGLSLSESE